MQPVLDVCLVAGRRPELLLRTLTTFSERLLQNFTVARALVNVDPIFGDAEAGAATLAIIRGFFPAAEITTPETSGFCAAVRSNWSRSTAPVVLHLEDDWELNEEVSADVLADFGDPKIAQLSFDCALKKWNFNKRGEYHHVRRDIRLLGGRLRIKRYFPQFATSPSFFRGDFARTAAALMDARYDPEKQFFSNVNPRLERFVAPYKNKLLRAKSGYLIEEIGREWRAERNIVKRVTGAVSEWSVEP